MKDGGRRAFLAVLLVGLGLLVFLYGRHSVDAQMVFERNYPRVNESLYATVDADHVFTIDGSGELHREDMTAMLRGAELHHDELEDVVIGDGVTEICFGVFDGYDALRSLKIGDNVTRIAAGAVKNCPAMEYLYLPECLRDVGLDFLYECKSCLVVTPGSASGLPAFANVRQKKRILEHVDSLEALSAAVGEKALPAGVQRWWTDTRS